MYQSAAGDNDEERELNACIESQCPLFPTKVKKEARELEFYLDYLLDKALQIRGCVLAGYPRDSSEFSCEEFATFLRLDSYIQSHERNLRVKTGRYFEEMVKFMASRM